MNPRVTVLYKTLPAYRLEFFEGLRNALESEGVGFRLIYGRPTGSASTKGDAANLPWAEFRPNRTLRSGSREAIWQPVLRDVRRDDLVIVEQASRLLINYPLLARSAYGHGPKVALWGHGANLQLHTASRVSETLKRRYSRLPAWWFAYTEGSARRVAALGYPRERITVVQNAIDTQGLRKQIGEVTDDGLERFIAAHGATRGSVGLFIGSLYEDKRLPYLIEAAIHLRRLRPQFTLIVAGDGPDRDLVANAASRYPFIQWLGRADGDLRALALRAADVVLMPGLVGLAVLDSLAAGAPMITTDVDYHSPEIEYLQHGENGLVLSRGTKPDVFASSVDSVLRDEQELRRMAARCLQDAQKYTTEEMVSRFCGGVMSALAIQA